MRYITHRIATLERERDLLEAEIKACDTHLLATPVFERLREYNIVITELKKALKGGE